MISLDSFAGMAPKIAPTALADDLATVADGASFDEGLLTGSTAITSASTEFGTTSASTRAIAKPTASKARFAFSWYSRGEAFANLLAPSDVWGRVYFLRRETLTGKYRAVYTTKDHYSEVGVTTDPTHYTLGIPAPVAAPAVLAVDVDKTGFDNGDIKLDIQKTAYVFTIVDTYGHEGVPSAASAIVELPYNAPFSARIQFSGQTLAGINMQSGVRRLYRAAFDGSTSEWQFVADVPWAQLEFTDSLPLGEESEALPSLEWASPPFMEGLAIVNGAFLASFEDNRLAYSAYMLPHAWPESTRFPLPHSIVAIKSTLGGLFIGTKGVPYWASGADPAAAVPVNLGANYPCLSADSVVDMGSFVVYASHDGLVAAEAGGATLISAEYVDRLRWLRDFAPASIRAFGHEGDYYFCVGPQWWVFNPKEGRGLRTVRLADVAPAQLRQVFYDAERDTTVLLRTDGKVFDIVSAQAAAAEFRWVSKEFRSAPVAYSTGQVISTQYPVTLEVESDGGVANYQVTSERPIRLAPIGRSTRWRVGVRAPAQARVSRIAVCQSPSELV